MEGIREEELRGLIKGKVLFSEPMNKYTFFKIGGKAEVLMFPEDLEDLKEIKR